MMWRAGWRPCPHCCFPFPVYAVWTGQQVACQHCHELLVPGKAERITTEDGRVVDRIVCPWCGATQDWTALECIGAERIERVLYGCVECHRPFAVDHAPAVRAYDALADASTRELAWWLFLRWMRERDHGETKGTD